MRFTSYYKAAAILVPVFSHYECAAAELRFGTTGRSHLLRSWYCPDRVANLVYLSFYRLDVYYYEGRRMTNLSNF